MKKRPLRNFLIFILIIILIFIVWILFFKNVKKVSKDEEYIYSKLTREVNLYDDSYNLYEVKFNFESGNQKKVEQELKNIIKDKKTNEVYIETDRCITSITDIEGKCLASFYSNSINTYESKNYITLVIKYEYVDLIKDVENVFYDGYVYNFNKKDGSLVTNEDLLKEYDIDLKAEIKNAIKLADGDRTIGHKEIDYKVEEVIENKTYQLYVNDDNKLCILGSVDTISGMLEIETVIE